LAGVPFVSLLETLKNKKTPLGIETQSELGNIQDKKVLDYVKSYAPLEHIQKEGHYPHMLIYTNANDTSVPFNEPVAYYQALKKVDVYACGKANLSFYMDPRFGHTQGTLIKDRCDHYGILFAYVLKYLKKETL
jgi:protease II